MQVTPEGYKVPFIISRYRLEVKGESSEFYINKKLPPEGGVYAGSTYLRASLRR
jgi:hypothetical protein